METTLPTAGSAVVSRGSLVTADVLQREFADLYCDLIEGKVYEMAPPGFGHGTVEVKVGRLLGDFVDRHNLGLVVSGDAGFVLSRDPDTVLGADVAFVRKDRVAAIGVTDKYFPEAPALAVEIVSPSDTASRIDDKARRWLAAGCEMVWVVYPRGRSVTVYRSLNDVKIVTGDGALDGADVVPGFRLPLAELFAALGPG